MPIKRPPCVKGAPAKPVGDCPVCIVTRSATQGYNPSVSLSADSSLCTREPLYSTISRLPSLVGVDACIDPRADASIRPYNYGKPTLNHVIVPHLIRVHQVGQGDAVEKVLDHRVQLAPHGQGAAVRHAGTVHMLLLQAGYGG